MCSRLVPESGSRLSVNDLAVLVAQGAVPAGAPPLPSTLEPDEVVELERAVSRFGNINLAGRKVLIAEILGGRQVGIRLEGKTLMAFDLDTRELLRTKANPVPFGQLRGLRGVRPGRAHAHQTVTVHVAETTVTVEADGEARVFRRTSTKPVRSIKESGHGPLPPVPSPSVKHQVTQIRQASGASRHERRRCVRAVSAHTRIPDNKGVTC